MPYAEAMSGAIFFSSSSFTMQANNNNNNNHTLLEEGLLRCCQDGSSLCSWREVGPAKLFAFCGVGIQPKRSPDHPLDGGKVANVAFQCLELALAGTADLEASCFVSCLPQRTSHGTTGKGPRLTRERQLLTQARILAGQSNVERVDKYCIAAFLALGTEPELRGVVNKQ